MARRKPVNKIPEDIARPKEKPEPLVMPISQQVQDILIYNFEAVKRLAVESRKERQRLLAALMVFYNVPEEYAQYAAVDFTADGIFLRINLPEARQPEPKDGDGIVLPFVPGTPDEAGYVEPPEEA